jgi:hypothetical protein
MRVARAGIVALSFLCVSGGSQASAQVTPGIDVETLHVNEGSGAPVFGVPRSGAVMAKFVCGTSRGGEVAAGRYFTALNLTHPGREGAQPLVLLMDVIQTNGERRVVRGLVVGEVGPLSGREIDCEQIAVATKTDLNTQLIKGFVRLTANPASLSAPLMEANFVGVAVYTTAPATPQGDPIPAP